MAEAPGLAAGVDDVRAVGEAAGQGACVQDIRGQADRFAQRSDVLHTVGGGLTSTDLVACEQRLIDAAVARAGEGASRVSAGLVDRVLGRAQRPLGAEQREVVRAIATSGRGVEVVQALAGTGKTYTAAVLREVYEQAGYEVLGVAPTGRAARELGEQAGIPARTVDRLLIDLEQLGDHLPSRCVVVFDEAGMAPTRATARLLEAAQLAGAKVIAIGDPGQLASVRAGGWLRAGGEQVGALRLTEVMRQRDPAERRALGALHDRNPGPYLQWALAAARIETHDDAGGAQQQAVREWAAAAAELGLGHVVMIARDNGTRDALNQAARELRQERGELGEERRYGPIDVAVGDRVICRRNDALLDVDNGTRGTVRHADEDRVVIETDSQLVRELSAGYVAEHVQHAYALTGHGMQGATVERAFVVASPQDLTAGWSYTALSRARASTRLFIHTEQVGHERDEIAPYEPDRAREPADLLARVQQRMAVRDDEDLAIEQLAPAGHADDPQLTAGPAGPPVQEDAAERAEPLAEDGGSGRLAVLRERVERLTCQRDSLPAGRVGRLDELDGRLLELAERRAGCVEQLADLAEPKRSWLGRRRDSDVRDRVRLAAILDAVDEQRERVTAERAQLIRQLGDPGQIRSELAALERAITPLRQEHRSLRGELAERELASPSPWVRRTFGERPDGWRGESWDRAVREIAAHRLDHDITDPDRPLGPEPTDPAQHRAWEHGQRSIEHQLERLDRHRDRGLEIDMGF